MPEGKTLVMKFGGTSVGSAQAIQTVVEIVRGEKSTWQNVVVVTSAMAGVTNLLLDTAAAVSQAGPTVAQPVDLAAVANTLFNKHADVIETLVTDPVRKTSTLAEIQALVAEFQQLCMAIQVLGEATPRALDAVASLGERMSVRMLAGVLQAQGVAAEFVEATRLVVTDAQFQAAHPDFPLTTAATRAVLYPLLEKSIVPVITGFIGATVDGITTTLGRGGSDYSAAVLAAVLPADDVWIWTDVDGVMTADPRVVPQAQTIPELSYREVAELAYFGAKVLHPKTIRPVVDAGIGLRVCNTFNPQHPGTRIVATRDLTRNGPSHPVKAVTAIKGHRFIVVEGRGMLGVPGVAARTFSTVAATGTNVILITQASSEQSICFVVPGASAERVVQALEKTFAEEIRQQDIDRIWASEEIVIITVVGAGMQYTPGVASKVFGVLGQQRINIVAIAQGSTEAAISLAVDARDGDAALRALHVLAVENTQQGGKQ